MAKEKAIAIETEVKGLEAEVLSVVAGYKTTEKNKEKIRQFAYHLMAKRIQKFAIMRHMTNLSVFFKLLDAPEEDLQDITTDQFNRVFVRLQTNGKSAHYLRRVLLALKKAYRFIYGNDSFVPPQLAVIKTGKDKDAENRHEKSISDNLLYQEDIEKLIDAAQNMRDKAICAVLWDTGMRVGELVNLTIRDVDFKGSIGHIQIGVSKTKARRVPILFAASYLATYLETRKNAKPDDPLFSAEGGSYRKDKDGNKVIRLKGTQITTAAVSKMLKIAASNAGVDKRIHPHLFRHSRATDLVGKLTPTQMRVLFGWSKGSSIVDDYSHISGKMIDDAFLVAHGKKPPEQKPVETDKICPRCKELNSLTNIHCSKCGSPLDIGQVMKDAKLREAAWSIIKDPKNKEELLKYIAMELTKKKE